MRLWGALARAFSAAHFSAWGALVACVVFAVSASGVSGRVGDASAESPVLSPVLGSPFPTPTGPLSVQFSSDGKMLAVGGGNDDGTVDLGFFTVYDVGGTGELSKQWELLSHNAFASLGGTIAPNARALLKPTAHAYSTSYQMRALDAQGIGSPTSPTFDVPHAAGSVFSADGQLLAVVGYSGINLGGGATADGYSRVWMFSVTGADDLRPISGSPFAVGARLDTVGNLVFSGNRRFLIGGDETANGGRLDVFAVARSGAVTQEPVFSAPPGNVDGMALSDSGLLAVGRDSFAGGSISLYSLNDAGKLSPIAGPAISTAPATEIRQLAFSPNGRFLGAAVTGSDTHLPAIVFTASARTGLRRVSTITTSGISGGEGIAFSPSSRLVAVAENPVGVGILGIR